QWNTLAAWMQSPATYVALTTIASIVRSLYNSMRHSKAIAVVQGQAQTLPPAMRTSLLKSAGIAASLLLLLTVTNGNAQITNASTTNGIILPCLTIGGITPSNIVTA